MNPNPNKPIRVLHVLHGLGAGGAETWLLHSVQYLKAHPEKNLHFDFLITGGIPILFDEEIEALGSKIYYARYTMRHIMGFRKVFLKVLKTEKYDAIHDHQDFISGWHFLAGIGSLPPVRITHLHNPYNFVNNYVSSPSRRLSFNIGRLLMAALTTKITATSNAVMDEYGYDQWPFKAKRVEPVYCGFDVTVFQFRIEAREQFCAELGWEAAPLKIALFIGRLEVDARSQIKNQKNPEFAFELAKRLVSENKAWKFVFVGLKGATGEKMEAETIQLGLENSIKFLGIRRDIPKLLSASDVLVFPSYWEGLGMVAVEAQASGLPGILSNSVPLEAIVSPELVISKDLAEGIGAWQHALDKVIPISPAQRQAFSTAVRESPFSIENSVKNLAKLYS